MESNSIVIRRAGKADFQDLVKLYEDVWPDVPYDKERKANFVLNESKGIQYCAEMSGGVIGSRVSFFMNFFYGLRPLVCIQVGDTCTRKDCRGRGVLSRMNESLLHDFFIESGGDLIWNISVDASRRVNEKWGWKYIESLATLLMICRPVHVLTKIGWKLSLLQGSVNWDQEDAVCQMNGSLLDEREYEINKIQRLHVKYDCATIEWRLKSHSGIKVYDDAQNGVILYKIGVKSGMTFVLIGEVFAKNYDFRTFKQLIRGLRKETGADIIKTAVSMGHPLLKYYRKAGFIYNPRNKFLNHGVRVETEEMKEICYTPQNWAISMLDVDTF